MERRLESSEKGYPEYLEKVKLMSLENMVQVRSSATHEKKHGVLETERPRFPSLHLDSC